MSKFRPLVSLLMVAPVFAQMPWSSEWPASRKETRPEPDKPRAPEVSPGEPTGTKGESPEGDAKPRKPTGPKPVSPNRVLGRVLHAEPGWRVVSVVLEAPPPERDAWLVGRSADGVPRVVLAPVRLAAAGTGVSAYRVTHGRAEPGLEIVAPAAPLLNLACARLTRLADATR